jgi:hypothetical protein
MSGGSSAFGGSMMGFAVLGVVLGALVGIGRERQSWASYELLIDETHLVRKQYGMLDAEVKREDIVAIQEAASGELVVRTQNRAVFIWIPRVLNGYDEVRERLSSWREFEQVGSSEPSGDPRPVPQWVPAGLSILAIVVAIVSDGMFVKAGAFCVFIVTALWNYSLILGAAQPRQHSRSPLARPALLVLALVIVLAAALLAWQIAR